MDRYKDRFKDGPKVFFFRFTEILDFHIDIILFTHVYPCWTIILTS